MREVKFDDLNTLLSLISDEYGPWSDSLVVRQEAITKFADLTGDRQWIHVDAERSAKEGPFGATIAHGFLVLGLAAELKKTAGFAVIGHGNALNYGVDRVRFIRPVLVDSEIRCRTRVENVKEKKGGVMIDLGVAIHVVGDDAPSVTFVWKLLYRA